MAHETFIVERFKTKRKYQIYIQKRTNRRRGAFHRTAVAAILTTGIDVDGVFKTYK